MVVFKLYFSDKQEELGFFTFKAAPRVGETVVVPNYFPGSDTPGLHCAVVEVIHMPMKHTQESLAVSRGRQIEAGVLVLIEK